jgi:magnesium chelatase family protein
MSCAVHTGTLVGVDAAAVLVEVDLQRRLPCVTIVGLASGAVRESGDRVRSALQHGGFEFPRKRVVVNLAPADLPKRGTGFDLPIAVGILAASEQLPPAVLADTAFYGELGLAGDLRAVRGALSVVLMARERGLARVVLPVDCAGEAARVPGIEVLAAAGLEDVVLWCRGELELPPAVEGPAPARGHALDLREVRGQARARRALEVAAAGGHNLLMIGSPGCGKTMLAARLPTILPELDFEEAIDITRVHSVGGLLDPGSGLVRRRPFRAPHHSISPAGMVGSAALMPGEVSLAHHGVLFLDELPEFQRSVLELLRGPLEDREVRISRAAGTVRFPAGVSLVAASNPCPCGMWGTAGRVCTCPPGKRERYLARLSGPLLDRIDLHVWVHPVDSAALVSGPPGESSAAVRARVVAARERQRLRLEGSPARCNAELVGDQVREHSRPTGEALALLQEVLDRRKLSARAGSRLLKVGRTLADLDGEDAVLPGHVIEAASWRLRLDGTGP